MMAKKDIIWDRPGIEPVSSEFRSDALTNDLLEIWPNVLWILVRWPYQWATGGLAFGQISSSSLVRASDQGQTSSSPLVRASDQNSEDRNLYGLPTSLTNKLTVFIRSKHGLITFPEKKGIQLANATYIRQCRVWWGMYCTHSKLCPPFAWLDLATSKSGGL